LSFEIRRRDFLRLGAIGSVIAASSPYTVLSTTLDFQLLDATSILYGSLTKSYNRRTQGTPRLIARCFTAEGVRLALELALQQQWIPITVRSGGHCFENFVTGNSGGFLIDVSQLSTIERASPSLYRFGAGCTLGQIYNNLDSRWQVTIPGGSCPSVGLSGHALGGGYGFLSKRYGLVADYLRGVELVHVNDKGEVLRTYFDATTPQGAEALWAHSGGGGGQFGIVTRLDFRALPTRPSLMSLGRLEWRWSDMNFSRFRLLLRAFTTYCAANKAFTSLGGKMVAGLGASHVSNGRIVVNAVSSDPTALDLKMFLDSMLYSAGIKATTGARYLSTSSVAYTAKGVPYEKVSWRQCISIFGGANSTQRSKQKSAFVRRAFTDTHISVLYKYLKEDLAVSGSASFNLASFGGAVNNLSETAIAFRERSSAMRILTQVYWSDAAKDATNLSWCRRFHQELFADQGGEPIPSYFWGGAYVNYPDRDLVNYHDIYYGINLPRLVQVKRALDPMNIFKHPQGVI